MENKFFFETGALKDIENLILDIWNEYANSIKSIKTQLLINNSNKQSFQSDEFDKVNINDNFKDVSLKIQELWYWRDYSMMPGIDEIENHQWHSEFSVIMENLPQEYAIKVYEARTNLIKWLIQLEIKNLSYILENYDSFVNSHKLQLENLQLNAKEYGYNIYISKDNTIITEYNLKVALWILQNWNEEWDILFTREQFTEKMWNTFEFVRWGSFWYNSDYITKEEFLDFIFVDYDYIIPNKIELFRVLWFYDIWKQTKIETDNFEDPIKAPDYIPWIKSFKMQNKYDYFTVLNEIDIVIEKSFNVKFKLSDKYIWTTLNIH